MDHKILAINPGSTSTKIALYSNENELYKTNIIHSNKELEQFKQISDQYEMRYNAIMSFLDQNAFDVNELSAVVGRGGLLPPIESGAYEVNDLMIDCLRNRPVFQHASNLGAIIAKAIADKVGIKAYIYDSVSVDELTDIARISGLAEVERKSLIHALNMRAVAIKVANDLGKPYSETTSIVAHIGGGISITIHQNGKMIDIVSDDEGPFSPERAGRIPGKNLIELCYTNDVSTVKKKLRGKGGIVSYLGTNNALEVEKLIEEGDEKARLVYEAMAYQIAKGIGELATVVHGKVDHIILTGGISHSKMITKWISDRVAFIAPVIVSAGENELESLALGTLRVLKGEEQAHQFTE